MSPNHLKAYKSLKAINTTVGGGELGTQGMGASLGGEALGSFPPLLTTCGTLDKIFWASVYFLFL